MAKVLSGSRSPMSRSWKTPFGQWKNCVPACSFARFKPAERSAISTPLKRELVNNTVFLQWYGFEFVDRIGFPATPLQESMPRIPEPYASNIMYYAQYDKLAELSKGKNWSFVEVRPDGIVGPTLALS